MRSTTEYQLKKFLGDMLHENDYDVDKAAHEVIEAIEYVCDRHLAVSSDFSDEFKNAIAEQIDKKNRRLAC